MNDKIENLKSGKNVDDTMRITRLDGTPLIVDPDARKTVPGPELVEGQTAVSRLARRLDRARERGEDLTLEQALRDACPEILKNS